MDALRLMKEDHAKVKKLLKQGEDTTWQARAERDSVLDRIAEELAAHERMEEEVFYPALKQHAEAREIVLEGYQEHHVVDMILEELQQTDVSDERWRPKLKVLRENIEHHIEEEEGEMFKFARSVFDKDELEALGARMEDVKRHAVRAA